VKKASSADSTSSYSCRGGACADLATDNPRSPQATTLQGKPGSFLGLWLWVAAGFLFLALLWTALFIASRQIDARTVPLAPKEAKP
jgi:hypothetical protein